jgi:thiamine biosynthesis protein ThiI
MLNIRSSEIVLKGRNRKFFEDLLIKNIRRSLHGTKFTIEKRERRFLVLADDEGKAREAILKTFGVHSVSASIQTEPNIEKIKQAVRSGQDQIKGNTFRVSTKRADKSFPLKSQQVNEIIGASLVDEGLHVDLDNPQSTLYIEILPDRALVSFEREKGPDGLPVGASGKVLSLLSGGIDSPVSSWLLMKRGCAVDCLHLHSFAQNEDVRKSKIMKILERLREYHPPRMKLFAAPYMEFYKKTVAINPRIELVVFRRFLLHLANRLAREHGYKGLVTGDSLGQVASQTLDNLYATDEASEIPVFRPLIAFNKQEIVDLAIRIGTYDVSIEPFKDCCSLVAHRNPSTKVRLEAVKKAEEEIGVGEIVERTLELVEVIEL